MRNLRKQLEAMVNESSQRSDAAFEAYKSNSNKAVVAEYRDLWIEARGRLEGLELALNALYKEL